MTEEQIEKERAAFEEWYKNTFKLHFLDRSTFNYDTPETWAMFTGWLAAKEDAAEQSAWIPITEKYPEERRQEVIVKLADGTVRIAFYERWINYGQTQPIHGFDGDMVHVDGGEYNATTFENVEYWRPLPE